MNLYTICRQGVICMYLHLLKNDLLHGKLTNVMVMIFISISTMLSCASISMIYSSQNQISYFMDEMGNVADKNFSMMNTSKQDEEHVLSFLKENEIRDYQLEYDLTLPLSSMKFNGKNNLESSGCFATTLPEKYNLMFDESGNTPVLHKGEVGVPLSMKKQMSLKQGDILTVTRGGKEFSYKVSRFIRDSLYGSEMMGQKRFLFHPSDFEEQKKMSSSLEHALVLSVNDSKKTKNLETKMQKAGLPACILVDKSTARLSFMAVSMGTSALLLMSGCILLLMSFLIIRFTILFQIENNYTEIGIMKAIGFSHSQIKPLYLVKYMGISLIGTIAGFLLSIPFANLLEGMQAGVVPQMPGSIGTLLSATVVLLTLLMVYGVTTAVLRKLKKQSTMDAIRKGNEGESYHKHTALSLDHSRHLRVHSFLAVNDLLSHTRNSLMMILIYAFCFLLMLVPLTLKDSFKKDAFLQILKVSIGDLYTQQNGGTTRTQLEVQKEELLKELRSYDSDVSIQLETMTSASLSDQSVNTSVFLMKHATGNEEIRYESGKAPLLDNEVALSTEMAKQYDKTAGDSIIVGYEDVKKTFLITGTYSSMMNLGKNILAGDIDYESVYSGYLVINFSGSAKERKETSQRVLEDDRTIKLIRGEDMVSSLSGDMPNQISMMSDLLTMIITLIIFALTILFSKLYMMRMKSSIALLQSLGYPKRNIQYWLLLRCLLQAVIGLVLGLLIHVTLTANLLSMYFESVGMGTIQLYCDTLHMLILYPLVFITAVILAQGIVNHTMKSWKIEDLNKE